MRPLPRCCFVLLCLASCTHGLAAESITTAVTLAERGTPSDEEVRATSPRSEPIAAPARSARALIDEAGLHTFLEDRALGVASIDTDAAERWFTRPPRSVFLYTERPVEVGPEETVRGDCQRVQRWDSGVLNRLSVVVWQEGRFRAVLDLGQDRVSVEEQTRARGTWETGGVRSLPIQAIAWDDDHIRYAEGAERHELACVPALRTVACGEDPLGARGYCVDRQLVVRPWRAPMVPHVGPVIPAYGDLIPEVPEGDCPVRCEPSACEEALRMAVLPRVPLYPEGAPLLAVFRSAAACSAFAAGREEANGELTEDAW